MAYGSIVRAIAGITHTLRARGYAIAADTYASVERANYERRLHKRGGIFHTLLTR